LVFKEFNTRSIFLLHCPYNGATVEGEDYEFLATAHSMPNFRKKKSTVFWKLSCQNNICFNTRSTRVLREWCVPNAQGTVGSTRILVTVLVSYSKGQCSGFVPRAISAYYLNRRINTNIPIKCHTQH